MQVESAISSVSFTLHALTNLSLPDQSSFSIQVFSFDSPQTKSDQSCQCLSAFSIQKPLKYKSRSMLIKYNNQIEVINDSIVWEVKNSLCAEVRLVRVQNEQNEQVLGSRVIKAKSNEGFLEFHEIIFDEPFSILVGISILALPVKMELPINQNPSVKLKKLSYSSYVCLNKILQGQRQLSKEKQQFQLHPFFPPSLISPSESSYASDLKRIMESNKKIFQKYLQLIKEDNFHFSFLVVEFQNEKVNLYKSKILSEESLISMKEQEMTYSWRQKKIKNLQKKIKEGAFRKSWDVFAMMNDSRRFMYHNCPIIFHNAIIRDAKKEGKSKNLFVMAHGYQGTPKAMMKLKVGFKNIFRNSKFLMLNSYQNMMDEGIQVMGKMAAQQINKYLESQQSLKKKVRIIFIGHSMGGIILRSCLKFLSEDVQKLLHTFFSFGVPHLGFFNGASGIIEKGLNFLNWLKPIKSLQQLTGKDNKKAQQTYIYKLAKEGNLREFENIVIVSSLEDKYIPWNSSRIQFEKGDKGKHERTMAKNILDQECCIFKADVYFGLKQMNLDNMIGRTAHVSYLNDEHIVEMLMKGCFPDLFERLKF